MSRRMGECGKVKNSLKKPKGGKILLNYIKLLNVRSVVHNRRLMCREVLINLFEGLKT